MVHALDTHGWDSFYNAWVKPFEQIIVPTAVILLVYVVASGLLTRYTVRTAARSWHPVPHRVWAFVGAAALLGSAAFLPIVSQTHAVGGRGWLAPWILWTAVGAGIVLLLCSAVPGRFVPGQARTRAGPAPRPVMPIGTAVVVLVLWAVLAASTFVWRQDRPFYTYAAVVLLGVTATATALGQNLRIQLDAPGADGGRDVAAVDYALARLPMLSARRMELPGLAGASPIGALITSDQLSAIPAGALASAVARLTYTVLPGLTWRARLTVVDLDRVVVSLTRNGRLVKSAIISRGDLGLPPFAAELKPPDLDAQLGRARAQLLTGASAFLLVTLSERHTELQKGLCGGRVWKAVALKAIADEQSLVADPALKARLLRRAVTLDPGYAPARVAYLFELYKRAYGTVATNLRFARLMAAEARNCPRADDGWQDLRVAALLYAATFQINACLIARTTGRPIDEAAVLGSARSFVREVRDITRRPAKTAFADTMAPRAVVLWNTISCLTGEAAAASAKPGWRRPQAARQTTPDLALFRAGLTHLATAAGVAHDLGDPDDDLVFAAAAVRGPDTVRGDPSFWGLVLQNPGAAARIDAAVGSRVGSLGMLDLAPFGPVREKLAAVGVTTFGGLLHRWDAGEQARKDLVDHLGVSALTVEALAAVAGLADLHDDLGTAEVVQVFLDAGLGGVEELESADAADPAGLQARLAMHAEIRGLTTAAAFRYPERWLVVLRNRRSRGGPRLAA